MPAAPLHVAVVPDGNGRWASSRGLPRAAGYQAGARAVYRLLRAAADHRVTALTLFAFSSGNWARPGAETAAMLEVFEAFLVEEAVAAAEHGMRISILGRRDRLPRALRQAIAAAEESTAENCGLHFRLALDYSAREAIVQAACRLYTSMEVSREAFSRLLAGMQSAAPAPDVDLLIRTGGEQRLSDFLLWECAWAELYFTPQLWPDFCEADFAAALAEFRRRDRRFGGAPVAAAS